MHIYVARLAARYHKSYYQSLHHPIVLYYCMLGAATQKNRKKTKNTSPKFEIRGSLRFFRFFFPYFSFFSVFFGFCGIFSVFFRSELQQEIPAIQKSRQQREVLEGQELPNNTLIHAYKALKMSYKSYYNQQEPLNKSPLNQSKLAKMEKPKKKPKKKQKTKKRNNQSQI